ncbi:hypothetical protein L914_19392 [Phytophthora nicotianae]|uniref:Uncharacterized protein n=2 Tax=Phytophthora nicotianae TaxID=4792 RepID=W2MD02_PHYNI|nr:hypothetical protein L914_19392 [Phytophthora nicotianae]ETO76412.1 hypothetical protein F444_08179 [Phytophthora nicotianae P1976]
MDSHLSRVFKTLSESRLTDLSKCSPVPPEAATCASA